MKDDIEFGHLAWHGIHGISMELDGNSIIEAVWTLTETPWKLDGWNSMEPT